MAKPIDLYQGPAPAAMSQMGSGLSQAGANIGEMMGKGYASLGRAVGQIGQAAGQAYGDYKQAKTSNEMYKSILGDPDIASQVLGIPNDAVGAKVREKMLSNFQTMISEHGQYGAAKASQPFLASFMRDAALGREYKMKAGLAWKEAAARAAYSPKPPRDLPGYDPSQGYGASSQDLPTYDPVTGGADLNTGSRFSEPMQQFQAFRLIPQG